MGFTAAAGILGGLAVSGGAAVGTIAMIGVAISVVGVVLKDSNLTKIGSGLSLGASGAGAAGLGETAASASSTSAMATEAGGGATPAESAVGSEMYGGEASGGGSGGGGGGLAAAEAAAPSAVAAEPAASPVVADTVGNRSLLNAADSAAGLRGAVTPEATRGLVDSSSLAGLGPESTGGTSAMSTVAQGPGAGTTAGDIVAKGSSGSTGTATDIVSQGPNALTSGDSYWQSLQKWWGGLKPNEKLVVGQTAAGLVSGIGQGASQAMAKDKELNYLREGRNRQWSNTSGPAIPLIKYGG